MTVAMNDDDWALSKTHKGYLWGLIELISTNLEFVFLGIS